MKSEKVANLIIKAIVFISAYSGVFLGMGSVGGLECTDMTMLQFCAQEFAALSLIILALVVYANKDLLNENLNEKLLKINN